MNRRWVVRGRLNRHYNTGDGGIRVALDGMGWKMGGPGGSTGMAGATPGASRGAIVIFIYRKVFFQIWYRVANPSCSDAWRSFTRL
ncbi:MAG: hypothetical protein ACTSU9_01555 [Promethearchaeota archaeon]